MKNLILTIAAGLFFQSAFDQNAKEWKQLQDFNVALTQIAQSAEAGNTGEMQKQAQQLEKLAQELKNTTPPEAYNNTEVTKTIDELNSATSEFAKFASNKRSSKQDMLAKLAEVQNVYNKINAQCKSEGSCCSKNKKKSGCH